VVLDYGKKSATVHPMKCATTRKSSKPIWAPRTKDRFHGIFS
jgi:hypothetical protein